MRKLFATLYITIAVLMVSNSNVSAQTRCEPKGDIDCSGDVNSIDLSRLIAAWGSSDFNANIDGQGTVNSLDLSLLLQNFGKKASPNVTRSPVPTSINSPTVTPTGAPVVSGEWTQHAHDVQRTGYTSQQVKAPWRWKWSWNGPNANGSVISGKSSLPRNVQPVTGGGRVYIAAGARGLYGLSEANGSEIWNARPGGSLDSTAAYDAQSGVVYAGSTDGKLYKFNAANGSVISTFNSNNTINTPVAIYGDNVYFSSGTQVYALNKNSLAQVWVYNANSQVQTPPSYSVTKGKVVVGSADLYVHAINASNGSMTWRVKPSVRNAGSPNEFLYGWPVIAEGHGLVLMKMRLDWNTIWKWSPWPIDNAVMRSNLSGSPDQQALFALNLDNGSIPFITNVGHGGYGDNDYLPMGPQPVVKRFADNSEAVYTIIRGNNTNDGRWDSHFGEMLLDSTTVSGYQAGYVRFIQYISSDKYLLTDEQPNVTVAGDYLFGGHWMAGLSMQITDRSGTRGSFSNRIQTSTLPHIVTSASNCGFSSSHYCSNLTQDGDPRTFPAGFYIYHGAGKVYDSYWTGYATWIVSNNNVYYRSLDGAIVALESGNP